MRADSAPVSLALSAVCELVELLVVPTIVDATCVSRSVGDHCQPKSRPASGVNSVSLTRSTQAVWRNAGTPFGQSRIFLFSAPLGPRKPNRVQGSCQRML